MINKRFNNVSSVQLVYPKAKTFFMCAVPEVLIYFLGMYLIYVLLTGFPCKSMIFPLFKI